MRVLITGGAGFIGTALSRRLLCAGHEVICVDNLTRGARSDVPRGALLIQEDVLGEAMPALVCAHRPEAIVHLAAQIHVHHSDSAPLQDAEQNILGTLQLLGCAASAQVKTFVLASSGGAVYGNQAPRPTPESFGACAPMSPYGASKLAAELYCGLFDRRNAMRTLALRLGNVYGPGQSTQGESGVIALFLAALRAGEQPKLVGDGSQSRDYVFIDDAVRAFELALEREAAFGVLNIGTGLSTSVRDILAHITTLLGQSPTIERLPPRDFEIHHSCLDARRAHHVLGWSPRVALDDGLRRTVEASL